jgi:catechol 2,3-dioxygenase
MTGGSIPAGARIGHVHLKVADLDRAIRFYRDLMGFDLVARLGDEAAFLSATRRLSSRRAATTTTSG